MPKLITPDMLKCKDKAEEAVCKLFGIGKEVINSKGRGERASRARFVVYYLLKKAYRMKNSTIAQIYGKHHTSIRYGIERAKTLGLINNLPKL